MGDAVSPFLSFLHLCVDVALVYIWVALDMAAEIFAFASETLFVVRLSNTLLHCCWRQPVRIPHQRDGGHSFWVHRVIRGGPLRKYILGSSRDGWVELGPEDCQSVRQGPWLGR